MNTLELLKNKLKKTVSSLLRVENPTTYQQIGLASEQPKQAVPPEAPVEKTPLTLDKMPTTKIGSTYYYQAELVRTAYSADLQIQEDKIRSKIQSQTPTPMETLSNKLNQGIGNLHSLAATLTSIPDSLTINLNEWQERLEDRLILIVKNVVRNAIKKNLSADPHPANVEESRPNPKNHLPKLQPMNEKPRANKKSKHK